MRSARNPKINQGNTESSIPHRYNTRRRKQLMENNHQARIERLELIYKEAQDQMNRRQDEMQGQITKLMEIMMTSLKEKRQASNTEMGKELANVESDPVENTEATQDVARQEQHPASTPAPSITPVIYLNPMATNQFIPAQGASTGASPIDPITIDHKGQERTEGQKSAIITKEMDKYQLLEKRLKTIEGNDKFGAIDAESLSLVSNLVIPPKFKVPELKSWYYKIIH